jgi:4'-phosphopantetheinyl transferase
LRLIKYSTEKPISTIPAGVSESSRPAVTPPLDFPADEVHLWLAHLDEHAADSLKPLLAADEVSRADRFHFTKDRNHYIVARGLLRKLLATYLDLSASELRFAYAEKGKPSLEKSQRSSLNFNLAHSGGLALYAFSLGREIGVDLEFIREDLADKKIAERFFSAHEIEALKTVPPDFRKQAFFNCWTRKEAYIKARGEGLSMPLDEFDVSLVPGEAAALLRNHKEPAEVSRWSMQSVAVPDGYVAALVASGDDWRSKTFALD